MIPEKPYDQAVSESAQTPRPEKNNNLFIDSFPPFSFSFRKEAQVFPIPLYFKFLFWNKPQGSRVDAIPQPVLAGAVRKQMSQMGIAMPAPDLGSRHKKALSSFSTTFEGSRGRVKLGHPVPESNLSVELKSGSPDTISMYIPSFLLFQNSLSKAGSVPFSWVT